MTKIIQNKKYKLLVDFAVLVKAGDIFVVTGMQDEWVVTSRIIDEKLEAISHHIPLTTFIHCVEPVEESTYDKVSKAADKSCDAAWEKFENDYLDDKPKEKWPKVGVDMANGIDRAVFWLSFDNSQFVFKSHDILLEAIEKMKAIARELSGK